MPKIHRGTQRARNGAHKHTRVVRMYPVYKYRPERWNDILGEHPLYFIDGETRDIWFAQGALVLISRGKATRLLRNEPVRTQPSVAMGPSVFECGPAGGGELAVSWGSDWRPYCEYPRQAA